MSIFDSFAVALFCLTLVFFVLAALFALIKILSRVLR